MTAAKMLVVTLARTRAVLGAASRRATGVPPVEEVVGPGFLARVKASEESLLLLAEDLEVKEVDHTDEVFRDPLAHVVDSSGALVLSQNRVDSIAKTSVEVTLVLKPPAVAADKDVVVVIDAGANRDPLTFVGKTVFDSDTAKVPISGVPPGDHLVLASVDGYNSFLKVENF
jgi:hypothetical protein